MLATASFFPAPVRSLKVLRVRTDTDGNRHRTARNQLRGHGSVFITVCSQTQTAQEILKAELSPYVSYLQDIFPPQECE